MPESLDLRIKSEVWTEDSMGDDCIFLYANDGSCRMGLSAEQAEWLIEHLPAEVARFRRVMAGEESVYG